MLFRKTGKLFETSERKQNSHIDLLVENMRFSYVKNDDIN